MGKSKVSIIIPVYNTEEYVEEAILSILRQSLQDIEVIVINDGSTDKSQQVIENLSSKDSRIKLFSQVNQGQSVARNKGIDIASGEYIYFMDSDDILREDALEQCYTKSKNENLDIVFFDAENFNDTNKLFPENYNKRTNKLTDKVYCGCEIMGQLLDNNGFRVPVWINVIRRDFLEGINLKFHDMRVHEDEIFTVELFCYARRVGFINEPFFNRRIRDNSIMTTKFSMRNVKAYFYIAKELQRYANNNAEVERSVERYIRRMLNAAVRNFHTLPFKDKCYIAYNYIFKHLKYFNIKTLLILFLK